MTELIRLALKNGAAGVVAVPVADDEGMRRHLPPWRRWTISEVVICDSVDRECSSPCGTAPPPPLPPAGERIAVAAGRGGRDGDRAAGAGQGAEQRAGGAGGPGGTDEEGKAVSGLSWPQLWPGLLPGQPTPPSPGGRGAQRTVWAGEQPMGTTTWTGGGGRGRGSGGPGIRSALRSKFHRAKNTEQSRGPSAPRWCWSWRTERSGEIISGYDNVAVSADPDNPTVCQVEFSFSAAQGLNQIWLTAHITV